jgi:hypothetical protein
MGSAVGLTRWRAHRRRAGALGDAGSNPRAAVLHGECAGRPEDGGNPPDRAGDVEADEELRPIFATATFGVTT